MIDSLNPSESRGPPYILDTNIFIQSYAHFTLFPFKEFPEYWNWLRKANKERKILVPQEVKEEINSFDEEDDALKKWISKDFTFLPKKAQDWDKYREISKWVKDKGYNQRARNYFHKGADPYVIAWGLETGYTVVTFETPSNPKKVKIPVVCEGLGIKCCTLSQMLKKEGILKFPSSSLI